MKSALALLALSLVGSPAFAAGYYCTARPNTYAGTRVTLLPGHASAATQEAAKAAAVLDCTQRNVVGFGRYCIVNACYQN